MKTIKKIILLISIISFIFIFLITAQDENIIKVSEDVFLKQISENIFIHTSYKFLESYGNIPANGLLYIEDDFAVLVDTPWDNKLTKILYNYVLDNLNAKITTVIVTHSHGDCMGGLEELHSRGVISYCCELTKEFAKRDSLPIPKISFSDSLTLKFPENTFKLYFLGGGHTFDNIVVWLPQNKILFAGCLVKSLYSKDLGNIAEADLINYPITLERLLKKFHDVDILIPGHGDHGRLDLIEHTIELLRNN
ncbi:MAG: subclass B1 metallo-beta-lactamase [Ignavibacteriales bacterium]|nr:subclass B1 metallo-beta-lactamase [Ignavibacteriales bacterium]